MTESPPLTWEVGRVRVTRVEESIAPVPWAALVPAGEDLLDKCRPWLDPHISASGDHLLLSVHSFIVETPNTCIVVDTCIGRDDLKLPGDAAFGERLETALPSGFDGVDVVICTHLHFDHVGWNTVERDGLMVPRFPRARYLVTQNEMDAERDEEDTMAFNTSIAPLVDANCLDAVEPDHRIDDWVVLESSPGHTPGHVSVRINDGDAAAIITGDVVHTPLQFAYPHASSKPDHDPAMATRTRERIVTELADRAVLVLGSHFPPPTAGLLISDGDTVRFDQPNEPAR